MANNYAQFSVSIMSPSEEAAKALEAEFEETKDALEGEDDDLSDMHIELSPADAGCVLVTIYSEGNASPNSTLCGLLTDYLVEHDPEGSIEIEWAEWCDKARPEAFGGGACVITARGHIMGTTRTLLEHLKNTEVPS